MIIKRIFKKIRSYTCRFSNKSFVNYLKDNGIAVGGGHGIPSFFDRN